MARRLRIGDVVNFRGPTDPDRHTGTVIGHPSYAPEHDLVVIAPDQPRESAWRVLAVESCRRLSRRDIKWARRERFRLRQGMPRGFLERPQPGWSC